MQEPITQPLRLSELMDGRILTSLLVITVALQCRPGDPQMAFKPGDHICALYSTRAELVDAVAPFLAEGLRRGERCWYVGSAQETDAIRTALKARQIDVAAETARNALNLMSGEGAYIVHGQFNPETTIRIFNDAIEQAYTDGFAGFRAAARALRSEPVIRPPRA